MQSTMTKLGIDLGTTFTCAFTSDEDGKLDVLEIHHGSRITRSVVQVAKGKWSIPRPADLASSQRIHLSLAKRFIGRTSDDGRLSFDVSSVPHAIEGEVPKFSTGVVDETVLPEEISAFILGRIRKLGNTRLNTEFEGCVLAVPAYFTHRQREATLDAAEIAGFEREHVRLVPEPLAALVAHVEGDSQKATSSRDGHWLVVDIGGGTADFTVAYVERSETRHSYVVNATRGHNALGGTNFDEVLAQFVCERAYAELNDDDAPVVDNDRLHAACERAKEELSQSSTTTVTLEDESGNEIMEVEISLGEAEAAWQHQIKSIRRLIQEVLQQGRTTTIANVLVAGGTGNMPCVRSIIRDVLPDAQIHHSSLSEAVGQGAARIAVDPKITTTDVLPRGIGIDVEQGQMGFILSRNEALPASACETFATPLDNCRTLRITVYEGDESKVKDNILLGDFKITGIPPFPAGTPVEVTINIDRLGEVNATAKLGSQSESLTIQYQARHTSAELRRLRQLTSMRLEGTNVLEKPSKRARPDDPMSRASIIPIKRSRLGVDEEGLSSE
ncbi:heat shock protein 70 family [Colletotrichum cereale]|nr:heat shock protein 70 family [Colletotrichum cereale]